MTEHIIIGKIFHVGQKIAFGSLGEIYAGTNAETGEGVAIKLEPYFTKNQVYDEEKIYRKLQGGCGIPELKWFGSREVFEEEFVNALVTELLGPSLEDLFDTCGQRFSLKTTLMIADQMISRLEFMHSRSYIHRDVKPENFLIGIGAKRDVIHVIDFGTTREFLDSKGRHIMYIEGKRIIGTARYASINTHLGVEQSRRDDMESLGFVLMYFLRGSLPWQGLKAANKKNNFRQVCLIKEDTIEEKLCQGYPAEFQDYFNYCSSLGFEDRPDYDYLRRIFMELFDRQGFVDDGVFDWDFVKRQRELGLPVDLKSIANSGYPLPDHNSEEEMTVGDLSAANVETKVGPEVSEPIAAPAGSSSDEEKTAKSNKRKHSP